mgnify:CR=1 FL=1
MPDIKPRWDDPAFDDLKMDYMRRAWGDTVPERLTYDVSNVPIAAIKTAAAQVERTFFNHQAPHGSIEWQAGWVTDDSVLPDGNAVLVIEKPDRAHAMIILGDYECRLVGYGKPYDAEKRQQQVGEDGITIRSVDFVRVWGPKLWDRPTASRQMQTFVHTVISTLPKPR